MHTRLFHEIFAEWKQNVTWNVFTKKSYLPILNPCNCTEQCGKFKNSCSPKNYFGKPTSFVWGGSWTFCYKSVKVNFRNFHTRMWKDEKFTVKIFRKINDLVKTLLSRNFCQKIVKENFPNFYFVHTHCIHKNSWMQGSKT